MILAVACDIRKLFKGYIVHIVIVDVFEHCSELLAVLVKLVVCAVHHTFLTFKLVLSHRGKKLYQSEIYLHIRKLRARTVERHYIEDRPLRKNVQFCVVGRIYDER